MSRLWLLSLSLVSTLVLAQPAPRGEGRVVLMPGEAQLMIPNDEAVIGFFVDVQEADAARAQSLANQRVAEGTAALRRADPKAQLESTGYSAFPVYSQGKDQPPKLVGWRVRQGVNLRTTELDSLARTVQAGQTKMVLGSVVFRLSRAAREKAEAQLIGLAIANVQARIAAAAQALGVAPAGVKIEELSFAARGETAPMPVFAARAAAPPADAMSAPSLEAGQSSETLSVSARARLLP